MSMQAMYWCSSVGGAHLCLLEKRRGWRTRGARGGSSASSICWGALRGGSAMGLAAAFFPSLCACGIQECQVAALAQESRSYALTCCDLGSWRLSGRVRRSLGSGRRRPLGVGVGDQQLRHAGEASRLGHARQDAGRLQSALLRGPGPL